MEAFFPDLLDGFLEPAFLERVRKKFHYEKTQLPELQAVAKEMLPLMCEEAFLERKESIAQKRYQTKNPGIICEDVVMSLGSGLDDLQERYSQKGLLSQCYMLEVLASELLMEGYRAYNYYVSSHTDWHVAKYHFPGSEDELPLEMLPRLLSGFTQRVTCNTSFYMLPKKSVAFVAELTQDKKIYCGGVCTGCNNVHCINRMEENIPNERLMADLPLNYGYRRIFGNKRWF